MSQTCEIVVFREDRDFSFCESISETKKGWKDASNPKINCIPYSEDENDRFDGS